jgi:hypothetical protein
MTGTSISTKVFNSRALIMKVQKLRKHTHDRILFLSIPGLVKQKIINCYAAVLLLNVIDTSKDDKLQICGFSWALDFPNLIIRLMIICKKTERKKKKNAFL